MSQVILLASTLVHNIKGIKLKSRSLRYSPRHNQAKITSPTNTRELKLKRST